MDYKLQLQRLNLASGVLFLVAAILAGVFMGHQTFPITLAHLTQDSLAKQQIVPASKLVMDLSIKWFVVVTFVLAAVVPLLNATKWQKSYQKVLKGKVNLWRWIDMAVVGTAIYTLVGMLYGWHDLTALKMTGTLTAIGFILMWITEKQTVVTKKSAWLFYILAAVCLVMPLFWLANSGVGTMVYGMIRASWYVYASFAILLLSVVAIALNYKMNLAGKKAFKDYLFVERNHVFVNLVSRVALAAVLIIGLAK